MSRVAGADLILPNFLLIGAAKAGTTALSQFLRQHPDVCFSRPKETWFFNRRYDRGVDWFSSHFEHYEGETAIGEGTAGCLACPQAPARIADVLPDAQLIGVLRNPIDRAFSHYYTGKADADRSFGQVIRDEESEFGRKLVEHGKYIKHLRRYEQHFSRDQIEIVLHRSLRNEPERVMRRLYKVLGVDASFMPDTESRHNVTKYPASRRVYARLRKGWKAVSEQAERWMPGIVDHLRRKAQGWLFSREKPEMREKDREYLRDLYEPYNRELLTYLGEDLSHWK